MATHTSRNPSPATNQYAGMVVPAIPTSTPSVQDSSNQHLYMPPRPSLEKHEGPAQASSPGLTEPGAPMHLSGWETKDGPMNQIMRAIVQSTSGFLKLIVGIARLIPGLAKN